MDVFNVKCPSCQVPLPVQDKPKFCEECGQKLDLSLWKAAKDQDTQACEECCIVYPIGKKFCNHCGHKNPRYSSKKENSAVKLTQSSSDESSKNSSAVKSSLKSAESDETNEEETPTEAVEEGPGDKVSVTDTESPRSQQGLALLRQNYAADAHSETDDDVVMIDEATSDAEIIDVDSGAIGSKSVDKIDSSFGNKKEVPENVQEVCEMLEKQDIKEGNSTPQLVGSKRLSNSRESSSDSEAEKSAKKCKLSENKPNNDQIKIKVEDSLQGGSSTGERSNNDQMEIKVEDSLQGGSSIGESSNNDQMKIKVEDSLQGGSSIGESSNNDQMKIKVEDSLQGGSSIGESSNNDQMKIKVEDSLQGGSSIGESSNNDQMKIKVEDSLQGGSSTGESSNNDQMKIKVEDSLQGGSSIGEKSHENSEKMAETKSSAANVKDTDDVSHEKVDDQSSYSNVLISEPKEEKKTFTAIFSGPIDASGNTNASTDDKVFGGDDKTPKNKAAQSGSMLHADNTGGPSTNMSMETGAENNKVGDDISNDGVGATGGSASYADKANQGITNTSGNTSRVMTRSQAAKNNGSTSDSTAYNKKLQTPANYVDPKTQKNIQNNENSGNGNKGTNQFGSSKITLNFHVIVSPDFGFIPERDQIQVRTDHRYLGGNWNNERHVMQFIRKLDKGYCLVKYQVTVPKQAVAFGNRMFYKYACMYGNNSGGQYEFLYKKKSSGLIENRSFFIPVTDLPDIDEWHQYDGLMHVEPDKNRLQQFWSRISGKDHKKLMEETKMAAQAMLPNWSGLCFGKGCDKTSAAQDVVQNIMQVGRCMKNYFLQEDCIREDDSKFKEVLYNYLEPCLEKLTEQWKAQSDVKESTEDAILRLAASLTIVWLYVKYELNYQKTEVAKPLLFGLRLTPDRENKNCSEYETLVQYHFPGQIGKVASYLEEFLSKMVTPYGFCEPDWLIAVPLYHFLKNSSQPYVPLDPSAKHRDKSWWGTDGISKTVEVYKDTMKYSENMPLKFYFRVLRPLFEMDPLLPRTLIAVLGFDKHIGVALQEHSIDAVVYLANFYYYLNVNNILYAEKLKKLSSYLGLLQVKIVDEVDAITKMTHGFPRKVHECQSEIAVALDFFKELLSKCDYTNKHEVIEAATVAVLGMIQKYQFLLNVAKAHKDENVKSLHMKEFIGGSVRKLANGLENWLQQYLPTDMLTTYYSYTSMKDIYELKIFSWILGINTHDEELNVWWQGVFMKFLQRRLDGVYTARLKVELFCREDCSGYNPLIEECFSKTAFDIIENEMKTIYNECSFIFDCGGEGEKFRRLLSRMFESAWPKNEDNQSGILFHILTWPSFVRYLQAFYGGEKKSQNLLSDTAQGQMMIGVSIFEKVWTELKNGSIQMNYLKIIIENSKNFAEICEVQDKTDSKMDDDNDSTDGPTLAAQFKDIIEYRKAEVKCYDLLHGKLSGFLAFCKLIDGVDCDNISNELNTDTSEIRLDRLCKPQLYGTGEPNPDITFFSVTEDVLDILDDFNLIKHSITFKRRWKINAHRLSSKKERDEDEDEKISIDELVQDVWQRTLEEVKVIHQKLHNGFMTFEEVDNTFKSFKQNYKDMTDEIESMCKGLKVPYSDTFNKRVEQIEQYDKLNTCRQGAVVMQRIKEGFKLTGDFTVLEMLINAGEDKSKRLIHLTKDVVQSGQSLKQLDEKKAHCIEVFQKSQLLVEWLREYVKDTKEIKVLVDLAMMSAQGQGDLEVARVSCLHAAAVGYAPLIYELKPNSGFVELLHQCEQVWNSLKTDPNLPKKLEDTARLLDWLKHVKDSHGSVEVDALSQAESINARGVYKVGCLDKKSASIAKALEDVLVLKVPPEKKEDSADASKWKEYSYDKLKDLQSKLMLVAGKAAQGKVQVDRFMDIFDGITRLANTYTKLCKAGSILFKNWNVMFHCEPKRKVHTIVDFGLSQNTMQGTTDTCRNVSKQIAQLCEFMDYCLDQWQHDIEVKRGEFYFLNHFTTEQLVILRKEMAKLCGEEQHKEMCKEIYAMLSCVKPKISEKELKEAIHSAMEDLATTQIYDDDTEDDMTMDNNDTMETNDSITTTDEVKLEISEANDEMMPVFDAASVKKFIEELKYAGFSEKLAIKAMTEVGGPEKIDEGTMWCMEHEDDESSQGDTEMSPKLLGEDPLSPGQQSPPSSPEENSSASGTSVDNQGGKKPQSYGHLFHKYTLEDLTRELLEDRKTDSNLKQQLESLWQDYIKSATVASVSDFLSVQHLGYILQNLAVNNTDYKELTRPMPNYLTSGKPNLIVCPQSEMMQTVLSIYMYENGSQISLPTADEVLLCTEQTRLEEVELLWRRAFGMYKQEKIFCLLNADRLDYEVSKKAEEKFEKISKMQGIQDYRLVVICSREREDKSNIVTAFERHRVKNPYVYPARAMQQYLHTHYQIQQSTLIPAAYIDPQRCCVRVIKSERAGVGKTLKARRFIEQMKQFYETHEPVYISLHRKTVDISEVLKELLKKTPHPSRPVPRLFHIDIAHEVQDGVDDLLFNLLILGSLTDQQGYVWLRSDLDLYLIEVMPLVQKDTTSRAFGRGGRAEESIKYVHQMLHYLPSMMCWPPTQSLEILQKTQGNMAVKLADYPEFQGHDQLMDEFEFNSPVWQRVFQYLYCYTTQQSLDQVDPHNPQGNPVDCLIMLLRYCGIQDPSWAELRHFVWFLNIQLQDCDNSSFCSFGAAEDLPGFKIFVVKSMIQMSRDFATRSLDISEQTPGFQLRRGQAGDDDDVELFQMKRHWETSPHPYAFFNHDRHSMTFLGFNIDPAGNMVDQKTNQVLEQNVMPKPLQEALVRNRMPLNENFDVLQRHEKIIKLCQVMGNEYPHDPDATYVLTTDNTKKIMAIYMRFRCGIPVIIMGETGCGKTRLIKFMCDIQKPPGAEIKNMILMKVHGGTTEVDIKKKLTTAVKLARKNRQEFPLVDTVLFFDEANTTEEIGLIKQVMCDWNVLNQYGLRIVAACNPYRKHSDEMIRKLEQAGLGYHIEADQTTDKLGRIPMRRLVYRVQALPQSMLPLVWDFGQLNTDTEQSYIEQMVNKFMMDGELPNIANLQVSISKVLTASQQFMRDQEDECSFVSLRDVERTLSVMTWFFQHSDPLFDLMDGKAVQELQERGDDLDEEFEPVEGVTRSLILALGVCYHACLEKRKEYRQEVAEYFEQPLHLPNGSETIEQEINRCQDVFLDQVTLEDNIARNQALKENVFMMVVCIELRIPLFLVGKPGSSKSLAKTIVADAMQGDAARTDLFKDFKLVHMVSYQCSPLSTPDGIVSTFRQCAALQKEKNLDDFVSVVVLDEIGLAEDSPRMPLKALHPLLEDGCEGDEEPKPHKKVAFIGISNWALDPAKMNRGILVQRGVPDDEELQDSAEGICAQNETVQNKIRPFLRPMAQAYLDLYNSALKIREFFGLRDFYSIIKMVYHFSKRSGKPPTWFELKHAILRNFGGLDNVEPLEVFEKHLHGIQQNVDPAPTDPDCSPQGLIRACLFGEGLEGINSESRYLLILTENYAALKILEQQLLQLNDAIYIFGSSFPKDQEYTQVCRNINRIKICMETGQKVVLLNLDNLYESLYDALNQYYVYLGGQRFVDLGLGSHRVKCKVHEDFRLIVVAEKQVVYQKFPIPLINRLEKHTLTMETILTEEQQELAQQLDMWAEAFATVDMAGGRREHKFTVGDVFVGYDKDTAASIVLQVSRRLGEDSSQIEILDDSKMILLQCTTPEAIIRLKKSQLRHEEERWAEVYLRQQHHTSLQQYLLANFNHQQLFDNSLFVQVTTHSKLLSRADVHQISTKLGLKKTDVRMESLQEFDTEQQFCKQLSEYFSLPDSSDKLLFIQCDSGDENSTLIASAQYSVLREYRNQRKILMEQAGGGDLLDSMLQSFTSSIVSLSPINPGKRHVVFVIQLPRRPGGCFIGFQGGEWTSYHIDELRPTEESLPSLSKLNELSLSTLFGNALQLQQGERPAKDQTRTNFSVESGHSIKSHLKQPVDSSMYADMPLLEGYTEDDYVKMGLHPPSGSGDAERMDTDTEPKSLPYTSRSGDYAMGSFTVIERTNSTQSSQMKTEEVAMETDASDHELDVDTIVRGCIHAAAAMLEDESEGQRKTFRVQLMLKLMAKKSKDKSQPSFLDIVKKRVWLLLQDKERTASTSDRARQWLTNEAASQEAVTRAGTFVRSIWQNIEAKVTPLLAGVMAYCDPNNNLDLLNCVQTQDWLAKYWLKMFNSVEVTRLSYEDLQTASQRREVERILVSRHGYQGTSFVCRLPFSWIIKQQVDLLMHSQRKGQLQDKHNSDSPTLVTKLFSESELGQIISNTVGVETEEEYQQFIQLYITDYVRMVYKCESDTPELEAKLIENAVEVAAAENNQLSALFNQSDIDDTEMSEEAGHPGFKMTIPVVHKTFESLQSRLQLFSQAVAVWPGAVQKIQQFKQEKPDHPLNSNQEFTLDILILYFILEHMAPVNDDINQANTRLKWLEKVERMRHVIERMLETVSVSVPGRHSYGEKCMHFHNMCSSMWSRMCAVQLFIEHVCPRTEKEIKLSVKKCMPLWTTLGENADFKKVEYMKKVENFLKICNKNAVKHFFGDTKECGNCKEQMTDPVKLPCKDKHVVCQYCIATFLNMGERKCPMCKQELPEGFKPQVERHKNDARVAHNQYKQRCNSFFMDLVSRLCFAGDTPPDSEVIQKLLGYVTKESQSQSADGGPVVTQQMMVLQDTIDPTPIVRSFLLQHLLRSHVEEVMEHLNLYFTKSRKIVRENSDHLIQLCLLFVYCLEDANHSNYKQTVDESKAIKQVKEILQRSAAAINGVGLSVEKLEAIAGARFGLHIVSEWMHRVHAAKERINHENGVRRLFDAAAALCDQDELQWPRLYLMRQLSRRFGMDTLLKVSEVQYLRWVLPNEARQNQNDTQPDRFVVCGENYKAVREALTQALLANDMEKLTETLQTKRGTDAIKQRNLLLAVYVEVTLSNRYQEEHRKVKDEALLALNQFVHDSQIVTKKQLAVQLINNDLSESCKELAVSSNQNRNEVMLTELVAHFMVTLSVLEASHWIQPFLSLINNPAQMVNSLLPTMPQDDLEYVHEALLEARNANAGARPGVDANPVLYRCPNGHPYVIGDCGNPAYVFNCKTCNAPIGGQNYKLVAGNTKIENFRGNNSKGHVLGPANQRSRVPMPERTLSPSSVAILRLLTHMSMYIGANNKQQEIAELIMPNIGAQQVPQFMWQHMMVDLEVLGKAINRSPDDSLLLMHSLMDFMLTTQENDRGLDPRLHSKKGRQDWEKRFSDVYISPLLQGVEGRLQQANQLLLNDDRLGNNPLLRILYEADVAPDNQDINQMERAPALWNFRSRITIEDLTQVLNESSGTKKKKTWNGKPKEQYPVLKLFLQHEPLLRAIHYLPQITRLQRLLVQKYHGAIDRAEATNINVRDFLQRLPQGPVEEDYRALIKAFSEAWLLIKEHLATFGFGGRMIPKEYTTDQINLVSTPLAMLLPSWKGHGLCSIASVHFLAAIQNDFLENYSKVTKETFSTQTLSQEATSAHLVSYHPERDLLPMVLANSNYSLSVGQSTSHQYDFEGLQKQIEERLIKGKTLVKPQVETVVFRADFTNAGVFETLRKRIKQESLDSTLQQHIISESRQLIEINDSLAMLDIAIGFLVSGAYEPAMRLKDFLVKTLEMKKVLHSAKAMQQCCLKHVQALWLLLSQERAKIQAKYGQDAFDNVADKYQEVLPADKVGELHSVFQHTNVDIFMTELYECIMLQIAVPQDENDPDYDDNREHPLGYVLNEYIEAQEEIHGDITDREPVLPVLADGRFPTELQLKHCVYTWLEAYNFMKITGGRR